MHECLPAIVVSVSRGVASVWSLIGEVKDELGQ
jgi:hypothetical protein